MNTQLLPELRSDYELSADQVTEFQNNGLLFQNSVEPCFVQIAPELASFTSRFVLDPDSHSSQGIL